MHSVAARSVHDLFPATESVGNDQGVWIRRPDTRQQNAFANLHRYVVVMLLVAEGSSEPAATRIERFGIEAHARNELFFRRQAEQGLMMAVAVYQRFALQRG